MFATGYPMIFLMILTLFSTISLQNIANAQIFSFEVYQDYSLFDSKLFPSTKTPKILCRIMFVCINVQEMLKKSVDCFATTILEREQEGLAFLKISTWNGVQWGI